MADPQPPEPLTRAETAEAADMLRRLLGAVETGELDADDPASRTVLRHLAGAADALDRVLGRPVSHPQDIPLHEMDV
ncbi:MAG: hypothetical protein ACRD0J_06640 [Acidimicrobiales bacterium]